MSEYRIECRLDFIKDMVSRQKKIEINNVEFRRVEDMVLSEPVDNATAGEFTGIEGYILRGAEKPYPFLSDLSEHGKPGVPDGMSFDAPADAKPKEQPESVDEGPYFETMTKKQLLEYAEKNGIEVNPALPKAKIIETIKNREPTRRLEDMTQEELFALAEDKGIPVGQHWTKEQLLEALNEA